MILKFRNRVVAVRSVSLCLTSDSFCSTLKIYPKSETKLYITKDREENHEACRYLDYSPAANMCQSKQTSILTANIKTND